MEYEYEEEYESKEKKKQKELHPVKQFTSSGERTVNGTVLCIGDRVVKGQGKKVGSTRTVEKQRGPGISCK